MSYLIPSASVTTAGPVQADGKTRYTETHVGSDGTVYEIPFDADPDVVNIDDVRAAHAARIEAQYAATQAAIELAYGTIIQITKFRFLQLLTPTERKAIEARRPSDPNLHDFMYMLEQSPCVFLNLPEMTNGLAYLVAVGSLAANRPAQIIANQLPA